MKRISTDIGYKLISPLKNCIQEEKDMALQPEPAFRADLVTSINDRNRFYI